MAVSIFETVLGNNFIAAAYFFETAVEVSNDIAVKFYCGGVRSEQRQCMLGRGRHTATVIGSGVTADGER